MKWTKEEFIEYYELDEEEYGFIPYCATIVDDTYFYELEDSLEADAKRDIAFFNKDELPGFTMLEVDTNAINRYVKEVIDELYYSFVIVGWDSFYYEV